MKYLTSLKNWRAAKIVYRATTVMRRVSGRVLGLDNTSFSTFLTIPKQVKCLFDGTHSNLKRCIQYGWQVNITSILWESF